MLSSKPSRLAIIIPLVVTILMLQPACVENSEEAKQLATINAMAGTATAPETYPHEVGEVVKLKDREIVLGRLFSLGFLEVDFSIKNTSSTEWTLDTSKFSGKQGNFFMTDLDLGECIEKDKGEEFQDGNRILPGESVKFTMCGEKLKGGAVKFFYDGEEGTIEWNVNIH